MNLVIRAGESQADFAERVLREQGSIATFDVLYNLTDEAGRKRSITRLAASIHTLRHERGWVIDERSGAGELAVYTAVVAPGMGRPVGRVRTCPVCHHEHAIGTTCGRAAA